MIAAFECPVCKHKFSVEPAPELVCPGCGIRFAPKPRKPAIGVAPMPAAAGKTFSIQKTCASCGIKYPGEQTRCPECGANYKAAKIEREDVDGTFGLEKKGVNAGVVGGIVMIVIAAVWFFAGLAGGIIFYYPPILAVIGIYALIKGVATGNLAGEKARPRRVRVPPRPPTS